MQTVNQSKFAPQWDINTSELINHVRVSEDPPEVILAVGPGRSGTSVMLRVFATGAENADGGTINPSFQPLKSVLRHIIQSDEEYGSEFVLPDAAEHPVVFIKETLGPYNSLESKLNPLDILLTKGLPREKIKLILMVRDPLETWTSWISNLHDKLSTDVILQNFIDAYKTTEDIHKQAESLGITSTVFVYESLRDNPPLKVVEGLFTKLGLRPNRFATDHWDELPADKTEFLSGVYKGRDPAIYGVDGYTEAARNSQKLEYRSYSDEKVAEYTPPEIHNKIQASGLYDIYDRFRQQAEKDLGNIHIEGYLRLENSPSHRKIEQ